MPALQRQLRQSAHMTRCTGHAWPKRDGVPAATPFAAPVAGLLSQHATCWGVGAQESVVAVVVSCQWLGLGLLFSLQATSSDILNKLWDEGMWGVQWPYLLPSAGAEWVLGCCFAFGCAEAVALVRQTTCVTVTTVRLASTNCLMLPPPTPSPRWSSSIWSGQISLARKPTR